ncbi:hypothetical protein Tco_1237895 [Tanacetum coccineum]
MAPKRTTRSTPVTPTPNATTTTTVTEAQLQALIDQGVAAAMAEAEASSLTCYTLIKKVPLLGWNSHVMTVTHDVAYSMTWVDLRKKMTDKYCPRNEMKKLEAELWNLKVIGTLQKDTDLSRMKNNKGNRGNQAGNDRAPAKVYVVGNAGANPDNVFAAPVAREPIDLRLPEMLRVIVSNERSCPIKAFLRPSSLSPWELPVWFWSE